jgi:hypothetical protein
VFLAAGRGLAGRTRGAHLKSARRFLAACGRAGEGGPPAGTLTASDATGLVRVPLAGAVPGGPEADRSTGGLRVPSFGGARPRDEVGGHAQGLLVVVGVLIAA